MESSKPVGDFPTDTRKADFAVGSHIRHLRQARGLPIKALAERSGLSIALISQIERGISSASVRVLAKLADGLDVAISDMFEQGLNQAGPDSVIVRKKDHQRIELNRSGITKQLLTPFHTEPRLDIYLMTIEPGGSSSDEDFTHQGEEAGVVLEGGMELFVDSKLYVLGEGDSFRFASSRPHRYLNAGRKSARVMWVNYRDC